VIEPGVASLALHAPNVRAATTNSAIRTTRMALPPSTEDVFGREATVVDVHLGHNRPNVPWLSDLTARSEPFQRCPAINTMSRSCDSR
jgi:hypothetical protein